MMSDRAFPARSFARPRHRLHALRPALRYAILFVLGALLSGVTIRWGINPHDEGLMLQAGERIADGQLPYRDFYANYGPGQYFLVGGLDVKIGRASCRERVEISGVAGSLKKKRKEGGRGGAGRS